MKSRWLCLMRNLDHCDDMMISCVFSHTHTPFLSAIPPPSFLLPVATAAAASKAAAERNRAWREEEARQASLGKSKVDDITNQLKALKAEDRSANPLLQITKGRFHSPQCCRALLMFAQVSLCHPHTKACLFFGGQHRARERGVSTSQRGSRPRRLPLFLICV